MRGRATLSALALAATCLTALSSPAHGSAAADHPPRAAGADFNLDGHPDVVTGIPDNADGEDEPGPSPGAVKIIYGGDLGDVYITQDSPGVPDVSEPRDRFGHTVAVWYSPYSQYPYLVVGAPGESVGSATWAGQITVFPGGPEGVSLAGYTVNQDSPDVPGVAEAGDLFGWSLASGRSDPDRHEILAVGAPGEDDNATDSGSVTLLGGARPKVVHQDTPGIGGEQENGDQFGWSLAAQRDLIVVGVPYESIASTTGAGLVQVLTVRPSGASDPDWPRPRPVADIDQGKAGVSGVPEAGDHFGWSVAITFGEAGEGYDLAIGVPDESIGVDEQAGMVHAFDLEYPSPGWAQRVSVNQDSPGVPGQTETGDRFGSSVNAVHTSWGVVVHTVGSDGEFRDGEVGSRHGVHVLSRELDGAVWVRSGLYGIPSDELLRTVHLNGGETHLYVASSSPDRVIGVPWGNILYGGDEPVVVYGWP
ncbi:hypothetical protein AB0I28_27945 [Phytomonospora sp. NPDC050363]|uniref:hypothetical protein n=1 Tax=Phytomonospora sp. NPDC050363 TaxID=3155642 RepID=UPI0033C314B4